MSAVAALDGRESRGPSASDLVIDDDWTVADIRTFDDCDAAHIALTAAIVSIETQLDEAAEDAREGVYADAGWLRSAKAALRYKKAALQAVQYVRGRITRDSKQAAKPEADRILINIVKETERAAFDRALMVARERHPGVF